MEKVLGLKQLVTGGTCNSTGNPKTEKITFEYSDDDDDVLPMIVFPSSKTQIISLPSPKQLSHNDVLNDLEASEAMAKKESSLNNIVVPFQHCKLDEEFNEFVNDNETEIDLKEDKIQCAKGFKIFDTSLTFAYYNYKHLVYMKQLAFANPKNDMDKCLEQLSLSDLISLTIIENGIQDIYYELSVSTIEEFLKLVWIVISCHPDPYVITKCTEVLEWASQEVALSRCPNLATILKFLINCGAVNENQCPIKEEFIETTAKLCFESQHYLELDEDFKEYHSKCTEMNKVRDLPIINLSAILDALSFAIERDEQLPDMIVLLIWIAMDPQIQRTSLRSKVERCIQNAVTKTNHPYRDNWMQNVSERLTAMCENHTDMLCLVRGLPSSGQGRALQKIVCFGIIQKLLGLPEIADTKDYNIEDLRVLLCQNIISPKMDVLFLKTIISLIQIFVGNEIEPSQKGSLASLSQMISGRISQVPDNYLKPETAALRTEMALIQSNWKIVCHTVCDINKKFYMQ